jgi:flagellar basal body-associated protein FliL
MSDKAEKKPDAPAASGEKKDSAAAKPGAETKKEAPAGGGLLSKTPVLLGGAMIIEAAVLFAGFKFLGGGRPAAASGAELSAEEKVESKSEGGHEGEHVEKGEKGERPAKPIDKKKAVEVRVLEFKAPNKMTGRTFIYDLKICVLTKAEFQSRVEDTIKEREALIQDRVRTIVAQSDPEKLGGASEPGLETLRRQVKYQLDEIIDGGVIDEVLVPRCIPLRTDY